MTDARGRQLANGLTCEMPADSPLAKLLVAAHLGRAERQGALRSCAAKTVAIVGARRTRRALELLRRDLPAAVERLRGLLREPDADEILGQKPYPDLASLPVVPDIVDVFRKGSDIPAVVDEARRHRREDHLGAARHLEPGGGAIRRDEGPHRRHGPLHQDRARALPRRPAPARLRHRADHLAQDHPLTWSSSDPSGSSRSTRSGSSGGR